MLRHEMALLSLINSKGIPRNSIQELPETFGKDRPLKDGEDYYVFSGPLDEKTRPFCKKLLSID